jgi:hypothetical protein
MTIHAMNFSITFEYNAGQPEMQYYNMKDMMDYYDITFEGIQEAMNSNTSDGYTFTGQLYNGAAWNFCGYWMNATTYFYSYQATAVAGAYTAMNLNGTVDNSTMQMMMNFPVTKPNLTIDNYQWQDAAPSTMLAASFDLEWYKNGAMQTSNNLYNEDNTAIDWEDAYVQAYTAMDSEQDMVQVMMKTAMQVTKDPGNKNLGYAFYNHFEGTLTAPLDVGFGNTDHTPTNGSGWKIIVSIVVVAVVVVVAIALLGFCLLRRRGRSRSYQRV